MHPKVSVLMPSYNHGRFIADAIESVLGQTYQDFELIIVDDGSSDDSAEIIAKFKSPKLRVRLLDRNVGACEAMNIALAMSRGSYIAVCNSDDLWVSDKLEKQCPFLDGNNDVAAVFSDVVWINDDGEVLKESDTPYYNVFTQRNRSRWNWLRGLIENGNCLCHPSILIRRELYEEVGNYDNRLRQLPDLYMWTKVVQRGEIFVMPDRLVKFRLHGSNTSTPSRTTSNRSINEHSLIVRETFKSISVFNFVRAFGTKDVSVTDGLQFEIEKALYLVGYAGLYEAMFRETGLEALYSLMRDPAAKRLLSEKYEFNDLRLHEASGKNSVWLPAAPAAVMSPGETVREIRSIVLGRIVLARLVARARAALFGD